MRKLPRNGSLVKALGLLRDNSGEGAIDSRGFVLASGIVLSSVAPITWLRLFSLDLVASAGPYRIKLTEPALQLLKEDQC